MKESKRRRSLSGAVLIMILTVMFVLIILLTATLTTVTTANQRIYTKYEENQAYYTARSALDVFTQNMLSDGNYWAGKTYDYTDKTASPAAIKTGEKMKQGLALQLDLYKIHSQCETYGKDPSGNAIFKFAENMNVADAANIFSAANLGLGGGTPPEKDNFSIEMTTPLNGDSDTDKQYDYIEYQVTLPTLSDGSNEYGKFVDVDYTKADNPQFAKIKVEVLDRIYATEPSYTADQLKRYFTGDANQTGCPANDTDLMSAIAKGSRSKDYMKLKITSTVKLLDTEGIAVVIIETTEKNTPANDQALTATGRFSGGGGAQARLMGGGATMDIGKSVVGDGNNMSGSIFSLGQLEWTSSTDTRINKNEFIVAMDGISHSSNPTNIKATGAGSFAFWGGTSYLNNGGRIGDSTNSVPVFADKIVKESDTDLNFYGDVYATTFEFQNGNPNKVVVTGGSLYTKNLVLPDSCFTDSDGDGIYEIDLGYVSSANLKLCNGYSISSASGTHNVSSSDIDVTYRILGGAAVPTAGKPAFDINTFDIEKRDGKLYRRYNNLPFNVAGKNYVDVPTAQAYFGEYFRSGAFHEETGELKDYNNQSVYDLSDPCNAYSNIYSSANKNQWLITAADMLASYLELPDLPSGSPARSITGMIAAGNIPDVPAGSAIEAMPTGTVDIDLSSGDKYYLLQGNYQNCKWTVKGTNGRLILLIPEDTNTGIINPSSGYMDYSAISSYTVTFENCELVTENVNRTTGSIVGGTTKAPKIDIYGGTGSFFNTRNNNFICGYFMMPTGYVYLNNGYNDSFSYTNAGATVNPVNNAAVVGSVLCNEFCESNQSGVLYLDKNSGDETPGEPHLTVQSSQYVRS